tara:strand:- start:613 stop:1125 length:513 start_codon:yes stop_codon:yes gene_type:complete
MKIAIQGPMCSGKTTLASMITRMDSRYTKYSFGQKIKDIATELFSMKGKDRTLLINIADKMRDIDQNVWVEYVMKQVKREEYCIIDDLRFQNELDYLRGWTIISLTTPREERIARIRKMYPDNFQDHIDNMEHLSEQSKLRLPENTIYIDGSAPYKKIEQQIYVLLEKNK